MPIIIPVQVGAESMLTKNIVKYLRVRPDPKLSYCEKMKYAADKAAYVTTHLTKLMVNVVCLIASNSRLLMEVTEPIILYATCLLYTSRCV